MSRTTIPFATADISALARSLRSQLTGRDKPPGHVELLNMLARASGYRNFQHLRADAAAQDRLDQSAPAEAPVDRGKVERVARLFDAAGRLTRWPGKDSQRQLCLWALWAGFPAGQVFTERQVNEMLNERHLVGDHALLRRDLYDRGLVDRNADGSAYRRIEQRPPAEALALIQHLGKRVAA